MIESELLRDKAVLVVRPTGRLEAADFLGLARVVDPYLADKGTLNGLLVEATSLRGWNDFAALIEHLRFVRDHHRQVRRVAVVTDNAVLAILPRIAEHFAQPEIRVFPPADRANALAWLEGVPAL